ncbi:hypothetical protein [Rufibacter hautae]|uniref:Uncharacterized protein n=1 Tax=Rufibacter hautae TaxID=2595005 RepID=A0A5B6TJD6_9BACT|nr:hypothetical protein [Rufibacter hautae]KAA3439567.1 hypothetical protein FOA19_02460 [Rufibacter hautae]
MNDTIMIKLGDTWLDLPEELSIQIEAWNPLFETDRIPGTLTFPFTLPFSSGNNKVLGFPGHLSVARYRQPQQACQLFLMGQLWKVGKLNLVKRSSKGYEVNFQTDVGDISALLKEQNLRELDLGAEPLSLQALPVFPEAKYALFPVRNTDFFEERPELFSDIINDYDGGFKSAPANAFYRQYPVTPFPYLAHVLQAVLATFGYTVTGSWIQEEETRRLVIYNTHALYPASDLDGLAPLVISDHLPDMKVNEFLKAIRSLFCLGMVFNPLRKEVEILSLDAVARDRTYMEWTESTGRLYDWEPALATGFTLEMTADSGDALLGTVDLTYTVGSGKEPISCQAGTLPMTDYFGRLLPEASQKEDGSGKYTLRLLSYRGLQQDQFDRIYPLGTSGTTDSKGAEIGTDSLQWAGPKGLYERRHKAWLDFLLHAESIETEQSFHIKDFLALDCRRRSFIRHESGTFAGIWEKVSITVSRKKGLQPAKVPLKRIY